MIKEIGINKFQMSIEKKQIGEKKQHIKTTKHTKFERFT